MPLLIDKTFKSHPNEEAAFANAEPCAVGHANSSNLRSLFGCSISYSLTKVSIWRWIPLALPIRREYAIVSGALCGIGPCLEELDKMYFLR